MYDPRNGYRPMSEGPSRYSPDFLADSAPRSGALRAARPECCGAHRRDDRREAPARRRARRGAPALARAAFQRPYLLIYRTLATRGYLDPTLDPSSGRSARSSRSGRDPIVGNYGEGLARAMTARGWLSTWSGLASHAALEQTLPEVTAPTLVVCPMADMDIYPDRLPARVRGVGRDRQDVRRAVAREPLPVPGRPEGAKLAHPQDRVADETIVPVARERWPV
jgi:pimeloyl-ACP methyl ester carboxylesterase